MPSSDLSPNSYQNPTVDRVFDALGVEAVVRGIKKLGRGTCPEILALTTFTFQYLSIALSYSLLQS